MTATLSLLRTCTGPCGRSFPTTKEYFYATKTGRGGFSAECRQCHTIRCVEGGRRRLAADPEGVRASQRARALRYRREKGVLPRKKLTESERLVASRRYSESYQSKPGVFEAYLIMHAKIRNEKYYPDTVFDLDVAWLREQFTTQEGRCFWLRVPMRMRRDSGPWQVSLDRLSLDTGYTKNNVVLTSQMANMGRRATEVADFELFLEDVRTSMRME